jgi:hypothetical protein
MFGGGELCCQEMGGEVVGSGERGSGSGGGWEVFEGTKEV